MDTTDDCRMEEMETENHQTVDFSTRLSDETLQYLSSEHPSSSCRKVNMKSRPRLLTTKSFPPYSQCIGGLGEDKDDNSEIDSEASIAHQPCLRYEEAIRKDRNEVAQGTEEKIELISGCARSEVKVKWRLRRKERLGGSCEMWPDELERVRWSGKRRVEENRKEISQDDNDGEEATNTDRKHWRSKPSNGEVEKKEDNEDVVGEGGGSEEKPGRKTEGAEEMLGMRGESTAPQWSSPLLSKLLHSSTSSCSSINLSSAESDEVFSEGEDATSKRKTFKRSRSWKTFLTMMQWSLKRQSSWVQLAGHQGNFQLSEGGDVLKRYSEGEAMCLDNLMKDPLRPFVPQYFGLVTRGEHCYIRLEDLLSGLRRPVIMDCKMGVRTYQEDELLKARTKATLRSDMYQKMVKVDPSALSAEEHAQKGVSKWRYLQWRDMTSSTSTLGFRIEGIMMEDGSIQRDFRKILTLAQVTEALLYFTRSQMNILKAYHSRLIALSDALKISPFFRSHEVIGSSLLFVHDHSTKASVWMIDFGKTTPVPDTSELQHNIPWAEGSREDGYLIGLTSLITSLSQAINMASWQQEDSSGEEMVK
ncbi:inositol-trisphosphate 3-kinase A-like [Sphaeramia orbicularis]|uniref:Kinase n=1 Tax=Sphaeramia orbicularis TaxID=375764 RepID=A0A673ASF4_9TELE|nr:inositol-trisphosphate 3-kinase A-like [Sphaeramia orbicularis]